MTTDTETTWRELCPNGRVLYYEGDDPDGFRAQIKAEFGFDPADDYDPGPNLRRVPWGEEFELETGRRFRSYSFECPPEHLDAIYGDPHRWPIGS